MNYADLHRWSVEAPEAFWELVWNFCGVIGDRGERTLSNGEKMPGAAFFPDACINFAENLLRKTGPGDALVFRGEDKVERRVSWDELRTLVSRLQQLFPFAWRETRRPDCCDDAEYARNRGCDARRCVHRRDMGIVFARFR